MQTTYFEPAPSLVFDLVEGRFPPSAAPHYAPMLHRARRLLKGRSHDDIQHFIANIEWMVSQYFAIERERFLSQVARDGHSAILNLPPEHRTPGDLIDLIENWPADLGRSPLDEVPNRENTSELDALGHCISTFDLTDDDAVPDARASEYFAALTLMLLRECREVHVHVRADATRSKLAAAIRSVEAMDALGWAEHLSAGEAAEHRQAVNIKQLADRLTERTISMNARQAADKRHEENRSMKSQVQNWYAEHWQEFKSMDAAAEAIVHRIKLVPLKVRTVRGYLAEWKEQSARRP